MLQLVQLHLVVNVNVTIASTHKEHQLGRIENIVLPSFETGFYKSYTRGVDYKDSTGLSHLRSTTRHSV
jgi:hypothetical protein